LYVLERWLHRASISPYHDQFVLKGGLLLAALDARRTTRDGDLLAQMDNDEAQVVKRVQEIASIEEDDGVQFNVNMAQVTAIREGDQYAGVRVTMPASIGKALAKVALDINFGDPVTPGAVRIPYPGLFGDSTFEMLAYPIETVLAEKIVTAIARGETNTRERDWADLWRLTGSHDLRSDGLIAALRRTAAHREVSLQPLAGRLGGLVRIRASSYRTWRQRQGPDAGAYPVELNTVVDDVLAFADPPLSNMTIGLLWDCVSRRWLGA
jgi:hypothetical protein